MFALTIHISYRNVLILAQDEQRNRTIPPTLSPTATLRSYTASASIPPDYNESIPPEFTGNIDEMEQETTNNRPSTTNIDNYSSQLPTVSSIVSMPTTTPTLTPSSHITNSSFRVVVSTANAFILFITIANIIYYYQVH